jgi:N-methylhydantoinase B/oxoprolinase/acetone carboxylase alpha subunit
MRMSAVATVHVTMRVVGMQGLPEVGTVECEDRMDDGTPIRLAITIDRRDGSAHFDFSGTGPQVFGNTNAPPAVTTSAVIYSLRCLVKQDIPLNGGCLAPVTIKVRHCRHMYTRAWALAVYWLRPTHCLCCTHKLNVGYVLGLTAWTDG